MATMTHGAPLFGVTALVDQEQFQDLVQRSHSLIQKILLSIPDVHSSSIHIKTFQLKSPEITNMMIMATKLGFPQAPVLRVVSENCTLETSLNQMSEGLQLHEELLNTVLPKLNSNVKITELSNDIRDLDLQIHKMLNLIQNTTLPTPALKPVVLHLSGEYDIQLAAHLTLVQLEAFGQDVVRCLRSMEHNMEEELDS
ncbi:colony stimulating factor 3 (granulocyte) a [Eucyclogobius newberryi]|uniref:colony stimulating factor 3 (granulocyte) a n=1 Tax=Eucyclogobius newberryi TaxID=166745 RepID=UPI003B5CD87E